LGVPCSLLDIQVGKANSQHPTRNVEQGSKSKKAQLFFIGYWLFLVRYWIFRLEKRIANTQQGISNKEGKAKRPDCFLLVIGCSLFAIGYSGWKSE
jgi:hypothetical protein